MCGVGVFMGGLGGALAAFGKVVGARLSARGAISNIDIGLTALGVGLLSVIVVFRKLALNYFILYRSRNVKDSGFFADA